MNAPARFKRLTDACYVTGLVPSGPLPKTTLSGGLPDTYEEMERGIAPRG